MNRDAKIFDLIEEEKKRQTNGIELIASENFVSDQVMQAMGSCLTNKYAEGFPNKRYYGGCEVVDKVEQLAIDRAKELFGVEYANVQPHSGSQANAAVFLAVLKPGEKMLGFNLAHGGHLTHGSPVNFSGKIYQTSFYSVEEVSSNSNAVFNISNDAGLVCFYLVCTENEENIIGRKDSVFSNKVCIPKSPIIYIPTAFTPNNDGKNDTWKPVIYGQNAVESYQFQVFNRWGTIIYRTESMLDFWDGTFNGNAINSGSYYYSYSIRYAGGLLLKDKGYIHLYR